MASFQDRVDARRKTFKKGVDNDDARRRREDETVQLRKANRESQLMKKRMMQEEENDSENQPPQNVIPTKSGMKDAVAMMAAPTTDGPTRLALAIDLRKKLARVEAAPLQEAIDAGAVPLMVSFLRSDDPKLQFEASWVLTNIASGDSKQTAAVAPAVGEFVHCLQHSAVDVQEQVIWALANIAGDCTELRDHVLEFNVVPAMLNLIVQNEGRVVMLRNATWALSNMCRGKPSPALDKIGAAIPYLARLLYCDDGEVQSDALWALSYIAQGNSDAIDHVINSQALPKVMEMLASQNSNTMNPALRTVGNICTGSHQQTMIALQSGILNHLLPSLHHTKAAIRKEALWLLSNVTAGTAEQIRMVLDSGLMHEVVQLCDEGNFAVRKEALWTVANACLGGAGSAQELADMGALQALVNGLTIGEPSLVACVLDGIEAMLKRGATQADEVGGENSICGLIEECGGLSKLEELQDDENEDVYSKAVRILESFFEVENDDEEDSSNMPSGSYDFGSIVGASY
jgi:hypothetical protein